MARVEDPKYLDEEVLIPHLIDSRAKKGYTRPYALISKTKDPADGFNEISYAHLSNAINRTAWYLDSVLKDMNKSESFAYIGPNDLKYTLFQIAALKTKRRVN